MTHEQLKKAKDIEKQISERKILLDKTTDTIAHRIIFSSAGAGLAISQFDKHEVVCLDEEMVDKVRELLIDYHKEAILSLEAAFNKI